MDTLLLDVALIVLAAARLTRLAVVDSIAVTFRNGARRVGRTLAGTRGLVWADDLVSCPHCIGAWLSAAVVVSYAAWAGPTWRIAAGALAVSYAVGHMVAHFDLDGTDD